MGSEPWDIEELGDWRQQPPEVLVDLDLLVARLLPLAEQAFAQSHHAVWSAVLPSEPGNDMEVSAWTGSGGLRDSEDVWRRLRERRVTLRAAALMVAPWYPNESPPVSGILIELEHRNGVAIKLVYPRRVHDWVEDPSEELARLRDPVPLAGMRRLWTG